MINGRTLPAHTLTSPRPPSMEGEDSNLSPSPSSPTSACNESLTEASQVDSPARNRRAYSPKSRENFFKDAAWVNARHRTDNIRDDESLLSGLTTILSSESGPSLMAPEPAPQQREAVLATTARHYVVMGSVGSKPKTMMPSRVVIDTGSGYNVIRKDALPPS